jgi:hypothetical protein
MPNQMANQMTAPFFNIIHAQRISENFDLTSIFSAQGLVNTTVVVSSFLVYFCQPPRPLPALFFVLHKYS